MPLLPALRIEQEDLYVHNKLQSNQSDTPCLNNQSLNQLLGSSQQQTWKSFVYPPFRYLYRKGLQAAESSKTCLTLTNNMDIWEKGGLTPSLEHTWHSLKCLQTQIDSWDLAMTLWTLHHWKLLMYMWLMVLCFEIMSYFVDQGNLELSSLSSSLF